MLPAVTNWPPKRFTPSICALESRPFLELPTPFLWAMRLYLDLRDAHRGQGLTVPAVPPVVLPPLELDHHDLGALSLREHLACHLGPGQRLRLDRHLAVLVDQEHLVELHRGPLRLAEPLDLDHLPRRHPVLLATRRNHRFHSDLTLTSSIFALRPGLVYHSLRGLGSAASLELDQLKLPRATIKPHQRR